MSKEHMLVLSKLHRELQLFLNKTETYRVHAVEKFKQVENIMKPWKKPNNYNLGQEKCLCSTLKNINISENDEELALLSTISKTLNDAELIKRKSSKTSAHYSKDSLGMKSNVSNLQRRSETSIKTKSKMPHTVKKYSSLQTTTTNNSVHSPCCPLFKTSLELTTEQQYLNLSEALHFYKIPASLSRTIKSSNKLLYCTEKTESTLNNSYKDIFLKNLEAQNEKKYSSYEEKHTSVGTFFAYLSALHTFENKRSNTNCVSWIFYKNANSLEKFHNSRFSIITKDSWAIILNIIVNEFIPVVKYDELEPKQKLQVFKIVKTICNFVQSTVPSVPIFRVQTIGQINESQS